MRLWCTDDRCRWLIRWFPIMGFHAYFELSLKWLRKMKTFCKNRNFTSSLEVFFAFAGRQNSLCGQQEVEMGLWTVSLLLLDTLWHDLKFHVTVTATLHLPCKWILLQHVTNVTFIFWHLKQNDFHENCFKIMPFYINQLNVLAFNHLSHIQFCS